MRGSYAFILFAVPVGGCYPNVPSTTDFAELEARIDALEQENAELTQEVASCASANDVSEVSAQLDDQETRVAVIEADYLTSADVSDVVRVVTTDTTWTVTTADELDAAIAGLDHVLIGASATLTIQIADGDYTFDHALEFHHPNGGRIKVVGNTADVTAVNLYWSGTDGIVINEGSALGYLGGMSLYGENSGNGLLVTDATAVTIGPMAISGFGEDGIRVTRGSWLVGEVDAMSEGWLTVARCGIGLEVDDHSAAKLTYLEVTDSTSDGIVVQESSHLSADHAVLSTNGTYGLLVDRHSGAELNYATNSGSLQGYEVDGGSYAILDNSTAFANAQDGYVVSGGSAVSAAAASSLGNVRYGFVASGASFLDVQGTYSTGNDSAGYYSLAGSYLSAYESTASGNGGQAYLQYFNGTVFAESAAGDTSIGWNDNDVSDFIIGL